MRQFGLAAWISFQDKGAARGLDRVGAKADALRKKFAGLKAGAQQFGRGIGQLAIGFAPFTLGLGAIIKQGAAFEQSIARLRSKMLGGFDPALKSLAKTLGATTAFSASQAADAMTNLAQSGFSAKEVTAAVPGVLAAAAAEGMTLATAADIVAGNVRAFGISAGESAKIAGVLALASSRANTDMVGLNEALKLAAPTAALVGAKIQDTTAIIGALADVGLKGTLGGTAFRASLTKLLKPTKETRKAVGALGLNMGELGKFLDRGDVVGVFQRIVGRLAKVPKTSNRASIAVKLFGVRGVALANALKQGDSDLARFNSTLGALRKETGKTAEEMARIQLGTLTGQFTLLKSALEGVAIEVFGMIAGQTSGAVGGLTKRISQLALALQVVNGKVVVDPKERKELAAIPPIIFDIAQGIKEGFAGVRAVFRSVYDSIRAVGKTLGIEVGGNGAKATTAMITKFVVLGAAIAPIGAALLVVSKIASGLFNTVAGGVRMVVGAGRLLGGATRGILGKIPILGKAIPGLGKVIGGIENVTAMPVRVVNFHEAGGLGGGSPIGPMHGPVQQLPGALTQFRVALNGLVSRIPLVGGALSSSFAQIGASSTSLVGKLAAKGGFIAAVAAAGFAGWKFGKFLDEKFGISSKIASWMDRVLPAALGGGKQAAADARVGAFTRENAVANAQAMANQLVRLARAGKQIQTEPGGAKTAVTQGLVESRVSQFLRLQNFSQQQISETLRRMEATFRGIPKPGPGAGGPKAPLKPIKPARDAIAMTGGLVPVSAGDVVLDRASLAAAVTSQLRGGLAGRAGAGLLGGGDPGQATPPQARGGGGSMTIHIPLSIDGRQIALAVAEVRLDDIERSGGRLEPGSRSSLLTRGFLGGDR